MCHGVAGKLVPTICEGTQFIPGNVVAVLRNAFAPFGGWEATFSHFLVGFIQCAIGLVHMLPLVVKFSSASVVLKRSLVTQVADRRCPFEEVVPICENAVCFMDDGVRRATNERTVVLRAR